MSLMAEYSSKLASQQPLHLEVKSEPKLGSSILDLIGNTPLLSFKRVTKAVAPVQVMAKAEWYNPGGSVKDRAAMAMILDGERRGLLTRDKILIDATSGNTGIAYAMIAAERGYKVALALPATPARNASNAFCAYGAELILTDPTESTDGAAICEEARRRKSRQVFLSRPIQQRRQLESALQHHRDGNLAAD